MPRRFTYIRQGARNIFANLERDEGFRTLIRSLSSKGMRAIGIMGLLGSSVYCIAYLFLGRNPVWIDYSDPTTLRLWDKTVIMLLSAACLVPAIRRSTIDYGRLVVALVVLVAGFASYTDDLAANGTSFSGAWWTLMYLLAVAAMPYKPWHTILFGTAIFVIFEVAPILVGPLLPTPDPVLPDAQQSVFLVVLTFLCTGISALIYVNRYQQYLKRKRIAHLERRVNRLIGRVVDPAVAYDLIRRADKNIAGEKRLVTMLMSDLRGFSVVSELLPPERVMELLNIYLARMAEVIAKHGGTIDEFIGDAIFALFGAPQHFPDHALRALACAIDMQLCMESVNVELEAHGMRRVEMGVGVHTGEVIAGYIGSHQTRLKYGAVGSHVNLTARIESYTVGGQILTTEQSLSQAGNEVIIGRQMLLSTKGFSDPISIFEVEGVNEPYHLSLPIWHEDLRDLSTPWPFEFSILDGKHLTGATGNGRIDRLATTGAVVRLSQRVESLCNLKIKLLGLEDESQPVGDLYCKVVDEKEEGHVQVRFTAVPVEVADLVRKACTTGDASPT